MSERELFNEVLKHFVEQYNLEIEHPYENSSYILLKQNGLELDGMNPEGYNLLANLTRLVQILRGNLQ